MPESLTFKKFSDFIPKNNVQPNTLRYVALDESNQNVLVQADIPGGPITVNEAGELIGPIVVSVSTDAELESVELEVGQLAYSSDTSIFRLGDGSTLGGLRFPRFFDNRSIQLTNTTLYDLDAENNITSITTGTKHKPGFFSLDFNIPLPGTFKATNLVPQGNSTVVLGYGNRTTVEAVGSIVVGGDSTATAPNTVVIGYNVTSWVSDMVVVGAENGLKIPVNPATPNPPEAGVIYFNSLTNKFMGYNGTEWVELG